MSLMVSNVSKAFGPTLALRDVSLTIEPGQVHGLIGHNGSGKSTLIKILSGYHQADSGSVAVASPDGLVREFANGEIRFVHQNLGLIDQLSVVENLTMGSASVDGLFHPIKKAKEIRLAFESLERVHARFAPTSLVGALRPSERTAVALARALRGWSNDEGYLVLDEPTSVMPRTEVRSLFDFVRGVQKQGKGVLYVSHHLEEIFSICDVVTVFRDGQSLGTHRVDSLTHDQLVDMVVGREVTSDATVVAAAAVNPAANDDDGLIVENLWGERVHGISLHVRPGEIVGLSGVTGSGREVVLPLIYGERDGRGDVSVGGTPLKKRRPNVSAKNGMLLVPAERRTEALFPEMTMQENLYPLGSASRYLKPISRAQEVRSTGDWLTRLNVRPNDPRALVSTASGGNQQKIVMARVLDRRPRVLLLDEPTQGVDVGARAEIHRIIRQAAEDGCAVLVASGDDAELASLCDRVIVMIRGTACAEVSNPGIEPGELAALSLGGAPWEK
jgi:ribose transport system ATP-binding protein